jgi:hypothetical protein
MAIRFRAFQSKGVELSASVDDLSRFSAMALCRLSDDL